MTHSILTLLPISYLSAWIFFPFSTFYLFFIVITTIVIIIL